MSCSGNHWFVFQFDDLDFREKFSNRIYRRDSSFVHGIRVGTEKGTTEDVIDQFRYIKIQSNPKDLSAGLWGITAEFVSGIYSFEPRTSVYCIRLKFNI